jgi:hypothetical protein
MDHVARLSDQLKTAMEAKATRAAEEAAKVAKHNQAMRDILTWLEEAIEDHIYSGVPLGNLTRAYLKHPDLEDPTKAFLGLVYDLLAQPILGVRQGADSISWNLKAYDSVKALYEAILDHLNIPAQTPSDRWFPRLLEYLATAEEPTKGMAVYECTKYLEPLALPEASTIAAHSYMSHFNLTDW